MPDLTAAHRPGEHHYVWHYDLLNTRLAHAVEHTAAISSVCGYHFDALNRAVAGATAARCRECERRIGLDAPADADANSSLGNTGLRPFGYVAVSWPDCQFVAARAGLVELIKSLRYYTPDPQKICIYSVYNGQQPRYVNPDIYSFDACDPDLQRWAQDLRAHLSGIREALSLIATSLYVTDREREDAKAMLDKYEHSSAREGCRDLAARIESRTVWRWKTDVTPEYSDGGTDG